jgi:predicted alpha/beta hydrolase
MSTSKKLTTPDGETIAYQYYSAKKHKPFSILFCCGFKSDISEIKPQTFAEWAQRHDFNYCCFDYFGHGESSGVISVAG